MTDLIIVLCFLAFGSILLPFAIKAQKKKRENEKTQQQIASKTTTPMFTVSLVDDIDLPIRTKVRGVSFGERQKYLAESIKNDDLNIAHSPTDEYPNAISVTNIRTSKQLGHVSSELAHKLLDTFGTGCLFSGKIIEITGGTDGKHYGCNIVIEKLK